MEHSSMVTDVMTNAALEAIKFLFKPHHQDNVLLLTDTYSKNISSAFKDAFNEFQCHIDSYLIENEQRPLKEIPPELEELLPGKTIVLNIIRAFPEEISFRIKWIFKVEENKKIRLVHMPGVTEAMILSSVNVDFIKMRHTAEFLLSSLNNAEQIRITTKNGTDIELGVSNRIFSHDIGVKEGEMCNLPCGEIYCAPLETEAKGVVVFDASIGDIGLLKSPLKVYVNSGKISKFKCDDIGLVNRITALTNVDKEARVIGELGIGVNPGARVTGNMLEDEKALGTAHIAFGNNEDFPGGGKNTSKIHRDYLFFQPTIEMSYLSGRKKIVMKDGIILT